MRLNCPSALCPRQMYVVRRPTLFEDTPHPKYVRRTENEPRKNSALRIRTKSTQRESVMCYIF
ncbi:hypothetical protein FYJ44_11485 [Desulfovibrio sp. PG-178-WT-4]|uniref:Uncharacterized protein n=1 Tax=Desulfovibrio porci TaxID=2605782 RepID=A0A6L5XN63_9BACT|nr:hypothetical protein [Desulfovibrio porci]